MGGISGWGSFGVVLGRGGGGGGVAVGEGLGVGVFSVMYVDLGRWGGGLNWFVEGGFFGDGGCCGGKEGRKQGGCFWMWGLWCLLWVCMF